MARRMKRVFRIQSVLPAGVEQMSKVLRKPRTDMYIELVIMGVIVIFALLFMSTVFLEKLHIRDFIPASLEKSGGDSPYFTAMNKAAQELGFSPAGIFDQNRKSRMYKARIALWISQDGETLLRIAGGKTAGVPIKRSTLTSFIEPDVILETWDNFGMADISGLTDRKIILNAHLDELVNGHEARLEKCSGKRRAFSPAQSLTAYEALLAMKTTQMGKLGLANFVDKERGIWRHTLKGALVSYFKGFQEQLAEGKAQKESINLKGPGSK
jgi:hypothetical protein